MCDKKKSTLWKYALFALFFVFVAMCGLMFWKQCWMPNEKYWSDVTGHLNLSARGIGYSMLDKLLSKVYLLSGENVTVMVVCCTLLLTASQALSVLLLYYLYRKVYPNRASTASFFLAFTSVFVVAFFANYGSHQTFSIPYANVWHSPTMTLMRPAMIGVVLCTVMIFKNAKEQKPMGKWLILNALATGLCAWAKPSFVVSFLPALCICLLVELIRTKGKSFLFSVKLGLSYTTVFPVILSQTKVLFRFKKSPGTAQVTNRHLSSVVIKTDWTAEEVIAGIQKLIPAALFIIVGVILLIAFRKTNKKLLGFCGVYFLVSEFFYLFVKETGERSTHGNFEWSVMAFLYVMMAFVAGEIFLKPAEKDISKKWKVVAAVIYAGHLITGLMYFWQMFNGNNYQFFYNVV